MIETPPRHQDVQTASPPAGAAASEPPLLAVEHLAVHFGDRPALCDVTLAFGRGEVVAVIGPNGAGKSTLLRVMAGMLPPSHGAVRYAGAPLRRPHPAIAYVPQRTGVDWMFPVSTLDTTLMASAEHAPRWRPFSRREKVRALEALDRLGMRPFADVPIGALSGGQQQRVFLARALLADGSVLLLDEPFAGVDLPTQGVFIELFAELRKRGVTVVYATHDLAQAASAAGRVVLIDRAVVGDGPPAEVLAEDGLRTAFGARMALAVAGSR